MILLSSEKEKGTNKSKKIDTEMCFVKKEISMSH